MEDKKVTLTIQKANDGGVKRDVLLSRDFSNVPNPVPSFGITERRPEGTTVGYIKLHEFNSLTVQKMKEAILSLKGQGVNSFVIDVRGNGGGALQSALWTAKLFLGNNKIIMNSVTGNRMAPYRATKSNVLLGPNVPLVALIDKGSGVGHRNIC
ncbi:hypothetical protein ACHAWF_012744 [Thalassiosira exigua]